MSGQDFEINLDDDASEPSLGEKLYAQRIAAGVAEMPVQGDEHLTKGVVASLDLAKIEVMSESNDMRDFVNQSIGRAQMADALSKFSGTIGISIVANIKERKFYKGLRGQRNPNSSEIMRGTWADYCSLLGRSVDSVDIDIANFKAFGEDDPCRV